MNVKQEAQLLKERRFLTFTRQTLVFGMPNNIVWRVKQYCLEVLTILFRGSNTWVPLHKHSFYPTGRNKYAATSAWIFLKEPTFPDFYKVCVSWNVCFDRFCQANGLFYLHHDCKSVKQNVVYSTNTLKPKPNDWDWRATGSLSWTFAELRKRMAKKE